MENGLVYLTSSTFKDGSFLTGITFECERIVVFVIINDCVVIVRTFVVAIVWVAAILIGIQIAAISIQK